MDFHHPLFQSVALPLFVAFTVTGMLRGALGPMQGRRWAATGVAIALAGTAAWVLWGEVRAPAATMDDPYYKPRW